MKSLSTLLFQELDPSESRNITGGAVWYLPMIFGAIASQVINNFDHFRQGLTGSPEEPEIPQN